jgi:uncharacterized Fe-S cluster-containing radical SAM superfamily protein
MSASIDTEIVSDKLRSRMVDVPNRGILLTTFQDSTQAKDITEPINCKGVGRVRHFTRDKGTWPDNPLPIDPACAALGMGVSSGITAQVFQNAGCNWRCWYCFVPFTHLSANAKHGRWTTPGEMVEMYKDLNPRPPMIDLTGGQPDLVPEWIPWTMEELLSRGLQDEVFLWSDDNLSGDFFWTVLSAEQRTTIKQFRNYARVACFKGFDAESFHFNTRAHQAEFENQFDRFKKYVEFGLDMYAYVTFTCTEIADLERKMSEFVDRLQRIHPMLPLRTVPLEIKVYTPVLPRMDEHNTLAIRLQYDVVNAWGAELKRRFSTVDLDTPITHVQIGI